MNKVLLAVVNGRPVGRVEMDRHGRMRFSYDEPWRGFESAFPLSLSMPLASATHPHPIVESFLEGLLPDSDAVRDAWVRRFQASRHPFSLLSHVGEDCPGAFQFVTEERLVQLQANKTKVAWLTEAEIAERLRALRVDSSAWRSPSDTGHFSLAGAQAKTALLLQGGRWGVPSGRTPTTHILKPPIPGFDGHAENEHVCLELARALGLPTAQSEVKRFEDETAIVVHRYDRAFTADLADAARAEAATWAALAASDAAQSVASATTAAGAAEAAANAAGASARAQSLAKLATVTPVLRLHQEDMCQALAVPPLRKYQADGGPGPREIVALLQAHSSRPEEDVWTFIMALGFNWLVGGTDAHAKNYSLLHGGAGRVRLAPLYDLATVLPYRDLKAAQIKLSMKIGDTYRLREIDGVVWRRAAEQLALDLDEVIERLSAMARDLPERLDGVIGAARATGIDHPILETLATSLARRARVCALSLARRR